MSVSGYESDEDYYVIADKGEIGFIDYQNDGCCYNPVDEGPVVISAPFPFKNEKPQSVTVGETSYDSFTIKNTMDEVVDLWTQIYASNPEGSFTLSILKPPSKDSDINEIQSFYETFTLEDRMLEPGDTLTVWVSCKPKDIGLQTTVIEVYCGGDTIERVVFLLAEDNLWSSRPSKTVQGGYEIPKETREMLVKKEIPDDKDLNFLFPSLNSEKRKIKTKRFVPISLALNAEQICSIEMILGCKGGAPYVIHGPPGTGKNMTLVETIAQLYTTQENARILVCAPSNSTASQILKKLQCLKGARIKDYEIHLSTFTQYKLATLIKFRVVVSTHMCAPFLKAKGVDRGHFTHIFLDDAQASEPENVIAISDLCSSDTVVVLAGDPRPLGPVIYSRDADSFVLGKSYLERLFECGYYCEGDESYVTKLVKNYRCHPEILDLPSKLFFDGELVASIEDTDSVLASLNFIPNNKFPMVFYGILGCDEREDNHLSWFNRIEISKVVETINRLTASDCVRKENIGVITPYRRQVLKINEVLDSFEMTEVKVGSVEEFQGIEKQVIIISMVRSIVKHMEFDRDNCLGFLNNPRRFNGAITGAISLLVIIGNPHIICKDTNWNKLLWKCVDNGAYQGCNLPKRKSRAEVSH